MADIKSLKNNAVIGQQLLDGLQAKPNESITLEEVTLSAMSIKQSLRRELGRARSKGIG